MVFIRFQKNLPKKIFFKIFKKWNFEALLKPPGTFLSPDILATPPYILSKGISKKS